MDDGELVSDARGGDVGAFELLVRRYHSMAYRVALLSGAGDDADDVVQEAFVRAFHALGSFRVGGTFRVWLLQIVVNQARNLHRARSRRTHLTARVAGLRETREEALWREGADPESHTLHNERQRMLWAALRGLAEKDRQVLGCRFLLELSEPETAAVLGWPRGSVKSRTSRALSRLRTRLETVVGEVGDYA
ncbi:RNA polymerase sigma factor [Amycolatopsis lurida]